MLLLFPAYDPAADFFTGIAGRLCGEVVPPGMNNYGLSDNIVDRKAFIIESRPGITLIAKQGYHVARVIRVEGIGGIEVAAGFFKGTGAISVLMDVHSVEIGGTQRGNVGKPEYFRFHKNTFIGCTVKFNEAA